jgi:hypothetical protein
VKGMEISMKKNIFYDTNSIYNLFEYKNGNKKYANINMCELEKVAKSNNGYVTSIVLDEIKFKCYEQHKDYNHYVEFLKDLFPNKDSWYIKDSEGGEIDFKERKSDIESDYLYRIIILLIVSTQNAYEDLLGRKLNSQLYSLITKTIFKDTRTSIDDIIHKRYTGKDVINKDVNKLVDQYLYNALYNGLRFLSMNYSFPIKEIISWSSQDIDKFDSICLKEPIYDKKKFDEYKQQYNYINKQDEDEGIFCQFILLKMMENNEFAYQLKYEDIEYFWNKVKSSKTSKLDNEEAIFLFVKNSPDLEYIEIKDNRHSSILEEKKGKEYINLFVSKINKKFKNKNFINEIINNLDSTIEFMIQNGVKYLECEKKYFKYLIKNVLIENRSIEKNDANDFLIVTAPDYLKLPDSVIISFDENIKKFLEENNIFYDKEIYERICN